MTDTVKLYHTPVTSMAVRLRGQRAVVTDCGEYNGADIVALFQEEGAEVVASHEDLNEPGAAEAFMRRAGRVDILTANLARPFSFRPAVEHGDDEMRRLMDQARSGEDIFATAERISRADVHQQALDDMKHNH